MERAVITQYQLWRDVQHEVSSLVPGAEHDLTMCFVYSDRDPEVSLGHGRKALESIVAHVAKTRGVELKGDNLSNHIKQLEAGKAIHPRITARMESVRMFGNIASHHGAVLNEHDSDRNASDLLYIANWLVECPAAISEERGALSPSLKAGLELLRKRIEVATEEQKTILDMLKRHRRVSISGCAGSGKTLIAMEKASRLDRAGLTVLFLCHNPYLADLIADFLIYTDVKVFTFVGFLRSLLSSGEKEIDWDHYAEVSQEDIEKAFGIVDSGVKFDAVIVDEAQDFLDSWWMIVEQTVRADTGFLYLFFDNNQSLLPLRANYPATECSHTLTVNVRNSSEIANAVGKLNRVPVTVRPELSGGTMKVCRFEKGGELKALSSAVSAVFSAGLVERSVVVATEIVDPKHSALSGLQVPVMPSWSWQEAIRNVLPRVMPHTRRTRAPSSPQPRIPFPTLSEAPYPNKEDIAVVAKWARSILNSVNLKTSYVEGSVWLNVFPDYAEVGGSVAPLSIAHFFSDEKWAEQLPKPISVRLVAVGNAMEGLSIPLHSSASIKGLEADGVITYVPTVVTDLKAHAYVAMSRARLHQEVLILRDLSHHLPSL